VHQGSSDSDARTVTTLILHVSPHLLCSS
jgi:hypothetical protein